MGSAVARLASERGYKPVIGYLRNQDRAEALAAELSVPTVAGDIAEPAVRERLIQAARNAGELYGLAVLSGDPARVPIEKASMEDLAGFHACELCRTGAYGSRLCCCSG